MHKSENSFFIGFRKLHISLDQKPNSTTFEGGVGGEGGLYVINVEYVEHWKEVYEGFPYIYICTYVMPYEARSFVALLTE